MSRQLKVLNDSGWQDVILSVSEGSAPMVRKTIRRHQCHRFFTQPHHPISRLSYKAFLPSFRMTIGGKDVIMRETLIVILNEGEGSAAVMRKTERVIL